MVFLDEAYRDWLRERLEVVFPEDSLIIIFVFNVRLLDLKMNGSLKVLDGHQDLFKSQNDVIYLVQSYLRGLQTRGKV